jgi:hypothetical protein
MKKFLRFLTGLGVAAAFAGLTYWGWAFVNQPHDEAPWPDQIQGFSFSPFRADQDAVLGQLPSEKEIDEDLELLEGKTFAVRSYQSLGTIGPVSTAEPWHVWIRIPNSPSTSTTSPCTCCPTGKASPSTTPSATSSTRCSEVQRDVPGKPIVIGEVGWPSKGAPARRRWPRGEPGAVPAALPGVAPRRGVRLLRHGSVRPALEGANEGGRRVLGRLRRRPPAKFEFTDPIVRMPNWQVLAGILGAGGADAAFALLLIDSRGCAIAAAASWRSSPTRRDGRGVRGSSTTTRSST